MNACYPNNSLIISVKDGVDMLYTSPERILILGVFPVIIVVGLLGNVGFLFVIYKMDYMRNLTNIYLGNLAVADISIITVTAVRNFWSYINSPVQFDVPYRSSLGCMMSSFVSYITAFSSLSFVTLVIVERYLAICKPLQFRIISGKNRSIKLILGTWLGCSLLAGFFIFQFPSLEDLCIKWPDKEPFLSVPSKIYRCMPIYEWVTPVARYVRGIAFWSTLLVNVILSVKIIIALSQRNSLAKNNEQQTDIIRNQVARMLITNNAVFFVLNGPYHVRDIIHISQEHLGYDLINSFASYMMLWVGRVATVANSAVNPLIYNVTNPRYRQAFAKCFGCGSKTGNFSHGKGNQSIQISATHASSAAPQQAVWNHLRYMCAFFTIV